MTYAGPKYDLSQWRSSVSNGRISSSKLWEVEAWPTPYDADLDGPARAHPEAASACGALLRTAWETGYPGLTIAYSYRTYAAQLRKWESYQNGTGNLAARPGTSNHGWGVAFDMRWRTARELTWLHANAGRFGFRFDVPGENWHMTLQEGLWKGNDMTKEEKQQLTDTTLWMEGDAAYRTAYSKKKADPGPPPDNWKTPRKQGWNSARFAVTQDAKHVKAAHKAA